MFSKSYYSQIWWYDRFSNLYDPAWPGLSTIITYTTVMH